ncbi:hypothetical protein ACFL1S_02245 [Pseudomonadota bacterium]
MFFVDFAVTPLQGMHNRAIFSSVLRAANTILCLSIFIATTTVVQSETREIIAGPEYEKSDFHNLWWGENYRELWTTPIQVEVLDLQKEAGGLTPAFQVGGMQTPGIAMKGADGKSYTFRSVNKDMSRLLPPEWRDTVVAGQAQDQTSASHPGVYLVVNGLAEAVPWIKLRPQRLVVMPDDPALGEFRELFAGRLGTFGEYALPKGDEQGGFLGATEILSTKKLWARWLEDANVQANRELFLRYRIGDIWAGNWDRHSRQWRWANVPGEQGWRPIPEDPDQVFSDYQGPILWLGRWYFPMLLRFKDEIAPMEGAANSGVDRWLLADLDQSIFTRLTREFQLQLTDEVIDEAVKQLPPEWYAISGPALSERLKKRRDNLTEAIDRYYRFLTSEVSIRGTNRDDTLHIDRFDDGRVEISLGLEGQDVEPYYRRRFDPGETRSLRIYLYDGVDRVSSKGPPNDAIKIHVVGGAGDDVLDDGASGRTRFHDFEGQNVVTRGKGTKVDTRPYKNPKPNKHHPWMEPRDYGSWTRPQIVLDANSDLGLVLGAGFAHTRWGFRNYPYSSHHSLTGSYSTGRSRGAIDYDGSFRQMNSSWRFDARLRASGFESVNFFGFGNGTQVNEDLRKRDFYQVKEESVHVFPALIWEPSNRLEMYFGPEYRHSSETSTDTLIALEQPYGSGEFSQLGLLLGLDWDSRGSRLQSSSLAGFGSMGLSEEDVEKISQRRVGYGFKGELSYFPKSLDLVEDFSALQAELTGSIFLGKREKVMVAGRLGGRKVWGLYPWREAAFIGGQPNNRGFALQRFAGDQSLYGGAEARLHLFDGVFLVPGRWWAFVLADAGRVWSDSDTSNNWHPSYGGGVIVELAGTATKLKAEVAKNQDEGELKFYFSTGFAF